MIYLDNHWYEEADINVHNTPYAIKHFLFAHDILKPKLTVEADKYAFSGHVHPGITIRGKGKQSLRFPCFYFAKQSLYTCLHSAASPALIRWNP